MTNQQLIEMARGVVKQEAAAIMTLIEQFDETFARAARMLLECQGHVLVAGSGTSHATAFRLAHLLSCCGTPALFLHPGDAQHGSSGAVTSRDVVVMISKGGQTTEILALARIARQRGAKLVCITEKPQSPLGELCDIALKVVAPPDCDPYGMIATGSSLVNGAFADALCIAMLKLRGYTQEQFGQTHPGGAVGAKLAEMKK